MGGEGLGIKEKNNTIIGETIIDLPALKEACLGNDSLITRLLKLYLKQVDYWREEITDSVNDMDAKRTRTICHTVRGATAAIHAKACVKSLEKLSEFARNDDMTDSEATLEDCIAALDATEDLIHSILGK